MGWATSLARFGWKQIRTTPVGAGLRWMRSRVRQIALDLKEKRRLRREQDPLTRKGLKVLRQAADGVDFRIPVKRVGAWQVKLDISHRDDSPQPVFMSWENDCEPLKNPFGGRETSLLLRPGRHRYQFYVPLSQQETRGHLRLTTPGKRGWDVVPAANGLGLARHGSVEQRTLVHDISFSIPGPEVNVLPTYILLPITNFCNYKCVMCDHGIDGVPDKAHYPEALADMMIDFLNGATHAYKIAMTGLGESLMSPVFYRVVDSVRNPLVRFHFCSNGALLNQKRIDWILASPFSHLNVSLDAGTSATYYKIRRADWSRVVANLEAFAEALARSGRKDLRLILNMTLMKENIDEMKSFIDLAKRLGAGAYVNQLACSDWRNTWVVDNPDFVFRYADQQLYANDLTSAAKLRKASEYAWDLGVSFKPEDLMRPLLYQGMTDSPKDSMREEELPPISQCPYPWTGDADSTAVVAADGHVQMCCMQQPIGKIAEKTTLESVWNGPTAQEVRRDMMAGKIPKPCATANCWFVAKQRAFENQGNVSGKLSLPLVA